MTKGTAAVTHRLFAGFSLTGLQQQKLKQSAAWKESALLSPQEKPLVLVRFEGKQYLGKYLLEKTFPIKNLDRLERELKESLDQLSTELDSKKLTLTFFTQAFIS